MKNLNLKFQAILFSLAVFLFSCGKDPQPVVAKSAAKSITSFKFSALTPVANGTVTEANKTITVLVPNGTPLTALVPAVQVSEKASISPLSGTAQNFTNPVKYTVTAEDGSTQDYIVTVMIDQAVSFTITNLSTTALQQDGLLFVYGTNFGDDYTKNKIVLINKTNNSSFELPALLISLATSMVVKLPANLPVGEYNAKVFIGLQSKLMPETFTVTMHAPEISNVDKTAVVRGENLIITGQYFQALGNTVFLENAGNSTGLQIVNESPTLIEVKVPDSTVPGSYTLKVQSNQKQISSGTITVTLPAAAPQIVSINKVSFSLGEIMIINGQNFKKANAAANINFIPFLSGLTMVRSGIVNADGTQVSYSIPQDFTTGTYIIIVEAGGEFSEEYNQVIQIMP